MPHAYRQLDMPCLDMDWLRVNENNAIHTEIIKLLETITFQAAPTGPLDEHSAKLPSKAIDIVHIGCTYIFMIQEFTFLSSYTTCKRPFSREAVLLACIH